MLFEEFTQRLAHGQLKNTSAVDQHFKDQIDCAYMDTILDLTNQGLVDLSTRFPLFTKYVDLTFIEDQYLYHLHSSNLGIFLTDDGEEPFQDNFIKILDIFDSNGDCHSHDTNGHIMTPAYNSIRFSKNKIEEFGEKIRIRYQAKHPKIIQESEINLPPNLETALQLFVSSLYLSHMNGSDHSVKGDSYFAAYLRHIGEDENRNNSSTSEIELDTKFECRGFV